MAAPHEGLAERKPGGLFGGGSGELDLAAGRRAGGKDFMNCVATKQAELLFLKPWQLRARSALKKFKLGRLSGCNSSPATPSLPGLSGQSSGAMSIALKTLFRPADAGLLDYPHEAGNDGVEGSGF
jgi:hypothetical protein